MTDRPLKGLPRWAVFRRMRQYNRERADWKRWCLKAEKELASLNRERDQLLERLSECESFSSPNWMSGRMIKDLSDTIKFEDGMDDNE